MPVRSSTLRRSKRNISRRQSSNAPPRKRVYRQTIEDKIDDNENSFRESPSQVADTSPLNDKTIDEDDICPICHQLLYKPVITTCNHTLCQECMQQWTDVASARMTILPITDQPLPRHTAPLLEANCPMCRTPTTASTNTTLAVRLSRTYPQTYSTRQKDTTPLISTNIQPLDLYIGNTHTLLPSGTSDTENQHEWTFFIHSTLGSIVEEIQLQLHPTFRPSLIIRQRAPYEIRRIGWGIFTIYAYIILKAGYTWESDDAVASPDGVEQGMLPVEWTLDFTAGGRMGRMRVKVRCDAWRDDEEEIEKKEWERVVRAYQRDGRWEPPEDDE